MSRRTNGLGGTALIGTGLRVLAASAAMGLAVLATVHLCDNAFFPGGRPPGRSAGLVVEVIASMGVGVTVYVFAGRLTGLSELTGLVSTFRRRLGRAVR